MKPLIFRNVGLVGRPQGTELVVETLRHLIDFLEARGLGVIIDQDASSLLSDHSYQVASRSAMGEAVDVVIVVGGDGCFLGAARDFAQANVPVLGVTEVDWDS